jgi:hypothetical protein
MQSKSNWSLRWVDAKMELPNHDNKVYVEWQGFYDEHGEWLNREEIEEKLRDESVEGVQWLEEIEATDHLPTPIDTTDLDKSLDTIERLQREFKPLKP